MKGAVYIFALTKVILEERNTVKTALGDCEACL